MFAGRNIEHIRQIPEKLLDVTLQPLMFVLLFAYVFGGAIAVQGGNYREYIIGGILIQSLAFGLDGPGDRDRHRPHRRRDRPVPLAARDAHRVPLGPLPRRARGHGAVDRRAARRRAHRRLARAHRRRSTSRGAFVLLLLVRLRDDLDRHVDRARRCARPTRSWASRFIVVFPLTFLSNAFVPIDSLPTVLQWFAAWNPVSVWSRRSASCSATRSRRSRKHTWPLDHPVPSAFLYCALHPRDRGARRRSAATAPAPATDP